MNQAEFNNFCADLPHTTHVVQWGGHDVWKVGGKIFVVASFDQEEGPRFSFKCSDLSFELLKEEPGLKPSPYLASRGQPWIQMHEKGALSDADLKAYLEASWKIIASGLTKKAQREMGLIE